MMRSLVLFILVTIGAASASAQTSAVRQPSAAHDLAGTWQLVSRVDRTSAGDIVPEPQLGSDPIALLIYDRTGHVAAQLMRRNRGNAPAVPPSTPSSDPNNSAAIGGYDAYFGTFTVDTEGGTVTHTLDGALTAADVGRRLTRHFRITGDRLEIWFATAAADGRAVTRTVTWRRVG